MITAAQCLKVIGEPTLEKDMVIWDIPPELRIGVVPRRIYCNKRLVEPLRRAFTALRDTRRVNELKTWDGCFNIRKKRGNSRSYSLHAWGLAIDVNAAWNPFRGSSTLSPEFVKCFTDNGFTWGGIWNTPDSMHFELSSL